MTQRSQSPEVMGVRIERKVDARRLILTMSFPTNILVLTFSMTVLSNIYVIVSGDGLNPTDLAPPDKLEEFVSLNSPAVASNSTDFKVASRDSVLTMDLLSSFPEDQEISAYCRSLLVIFGRRYAAIVDCLVPAARPVKICQNCFSAYGSLRDIYTNISSDQGPGNESCRDPLLSSDRLMLVPLLYNSLQEIWSNCDSCIAEGYQSLTNDTLAFLAALNQTLTCFEKNQQGNQTDPCKSCKSIYGDLNRLYSRLDKSKRVCIDMEDSMNATRRLWSKSFNCSVPREETVPVIAVSAFMLFLPIIFYLSSFLHSEQKKRKLIHPKRAKSYNSLVNIQDKLS